MVLATDVVPDAKILWMSFKSEEQSWLNNAYRNLKPTYGRQAVPKAGRAGKFGRKSCLRKVNLTYGR